MWQRGMLLMTRTVQKWSREEKDRAKLEEEAMIFSDFSPSDLGVSRQLICTLNQNHKDFKENRALIECAHSMKVALEESRQTLILTAMIDNSDLSKKTLERVEMVLKSIEARKT